MAAVAAAASLASESIAPTSPIPLSLFAQLQAAQASEGGTEAAAAILLEKSKELLGLSEAGRGNAAAASSAVAPPSLADQAAALIPLDSETRVQLSCQAEELRGYSQLLLESEGGEAVAAVWSVIEDKYNDAGSGLKNEALNLWTQLHSSVEAKEVTESSQELFDQWKHYATTTEGHKLLEQSGQMMKSQSSVIAKLLTNMSIASVAAAGGAPSTAAADGSDSSQPAVVQKEHMLATTTKVTRALQDDDDVKTLMDRSSALLSSWTAEEMAKTDSEALDGPSSLSASVNSRSSSSSYGRHNNGANLAPEPTLAGDATGAALKVGENYLKNLRQTNQGNVLLAKASVLLQTNKDLLRPEALTAAGASIASDLDARNIFITQVKDIALEFLMSYLPTVVVPPISDTQDGVSYTISNIDLGGFLVDSKHVVVTVEGDAIQIKATHITCEMRNLIWQYQKLTFPRLSGKGTADANASDVEFILKLKLAYPEPKKTKQPPPPVQTAAAADEDLDDVSEPPETPPSESDNSPPASPKYPPPRKQMPAAQPRLAKSRSTGSSSSSSSSSAATASSRIPDYFSSSSRPPSASRLQPHPTGVAASRAPSRTLDLRPPSASSSSSSSSTSATGARTCTIPPPSSLLDDDEIDADFELPPTRHQQPASSQQLPPPQQPSSERSISFAQMATSIRDGLSRASTPAESASSSPTLGPMPAPMSTAGSRVSSTTSTASSASASSSTTSSAGSTFLQTVSTDLGQPKLVMHSCRLRLSTFAIAIHSGWFKGIYNFLLDVFSVSVKQYLENTLNNELVIKSVVLLDTINVLAVDYLPLLQRILVKATTAALEEDGQATAGSRPASAASNRSVNSSPTSSIPSSPAQSASSRTLPTHTPPLPSGRPVLLTSASAASPSTAPASKPASSSAFSSSSSSASSTAAAKSSRTTATTAAPKEGHSAALASFYNLQ